MNNNNRNNNNYAVAVSEFRPMYVISIESLYDAYFDTNRTTKDMMPYSLRIDEELYDLWREIREGTYKVSTTKAFMVLSPKKREIFAMHPRDKVVSHWIRLRLEPLFEGEYVSGTYSCRKGKGGSAFAEDAINAIKEIETECGKCFCAKLDLRNFFMSIDRRMATDKTLALVEEKYCGEDKETLKWLIETHFMFAPEKDFYICGNPADWDDYPKEKSLRTNADGCGLVMGNVNSQQVANYILTNMDRYIGSLGIVELRYVDDILLLDGDKQHLLSCIQAIEDFLKRDVGLEFHKPKRYFQDADKGIKIIGYVIRGDRLYIENRCVGNLMKRIHAYNRFMREKPKKAKRQVDKFVACINSYFGRLKQGRSYNIRRKAWGLIDDAWKRYFYGCNHLYKVKLRKNK